MAGKLWNFLQYVEKEVKRVPAIYSGYYYWGEHGNTNVAWLKYQFWLAWYNVESVIKVPPPWTVWKFWQYTDKGNGAMYGVESAQIDLDWYNGTEAELLAWSKTITGNPLPPQPNPSVCPTCKQAWPVICPSLPSLNNYYVNVGVLNVRSSPDSSSNANIIGQIKYNTPITVDNPSGNWAHFTSTAFPSGAWCWLVYLRKA